MQFKPCYYLFSKREKQRNENGCLIFLAHLSWFHFIPRGHIEPKITGNLLMTTFFWIKTFIVQTWPVGPGIDLTCMVFFEHSFIKQGILFTIFVTHIFSP